MMELLEILSYFNTEYRLEIVTLGEDYYQRKLYSAPILMITAKANYILKNQEQADKFFLLAIEIEPSIRSYVTYFLFREDQYPPADISLIEKALELPWDDEESVLTIAEIYQKRDSVKALEILDKAYEKWDDENSLRSLVTYYEMQQNDLKVIELIQDRIDNNKDVSDAYKTYLIVKYYNRENFEKIVENSRLCFDVNSEKILRYLFFAAFFLQDHEITYDTGNAIEELDSIPEEIASTFYAFFGITCYYLNIDDKAIEYFRKSNDLKILINVFKDIALESDNDDDKFPKFISKFSDNNDNSTNFLAGFSYALLQEKEMAEKLLDSVSMDFLKENDLLVSAALAYLTNSDNLEKAKVLLEFRDEQKPSLNEIIGLYYYNDRNDSLAFHYFMEEITANPETEAALFIFASLVAERLGKTDQLITILRKAYEVYPESSDILNSLGYSIAKFEIIEQFGFAESVLTKALEIEPESPMIWDSIAWLYFKMGKFQKAIESMEIPLKSEINHSEIAYHLGEIYLKLEETGLSEKYLRLAIELANDDRSVELSEELLKNELGIVLKSEGE
ncbi:MAG: hypothetical protein H8E57_04735 [Candidatus Cloacimonetes bacterium]|nr:hypothetical protein [Candidatus Cloacimonadota bacterium]